MSPVEPPAVGSFWSLADPAGSACPVPVMVTVVWPEAVRLVELAGGRVLDQSLAGFLAERVPCTSFTHRQLLGIVDAEVIQAAHRVELISAARRSLIALGRREVASA